MKRCYLLEIFRRLAIVVATVAAGCAHAIAQDQREPEKEVKISFELKLAGEADGPIRSQRYFQVGEEKIAIRDPYQCKLNATSAAMVLQPENLPLARIEIRQSPFSPSIEFSPGTLSKYKEVAEEGIHAESSDIELESAPHDPYPINDWTGLALNLRFPGNGHTMKRHVAFVNLGSKAQMMITVEAPEKDYDEAKRLTDRFVLFWHPLREIEGPIFN